MLTQEFGCEHCWPTDADAAWEGRGGLTRQDELIDESHFHVMILACPHCGQPYVSVFAETIDWQDGEDPQYWTLLPITEAEGESLLQQGTSLSDMSLNALGRDRRSLWSDYPKAEPSRVYWASGIRVGPHD